MKLAEEERLASKSEGNEVSSRHQMKEMEDYFRGEDVPNIPSVSAAKTFNSMGELNSNDEPVCNEQLCASDRRVGERRNHQKLLSLAVWRCEARTAPVLPYSTPTQRAGSS